MVGTKEAQDEAARAFLLWWERYWDDALGDPEDDETFRKLSAAGGYVLQVFDWPRMPVAEIAYRLVNRKD